MGKKKGGGKKARSVDADFDDASSTCSTSTTASDYVTDRLGMLSDSAVELEREDSVLEGLVDALYEKRASTREAGLKGIVEILSSRVVTEEVDDRQETLLQQLLTCLRKGGTTEAALAARALGLMAITLGAGGASEQVWAECWPAFDRVARQSSSSATRIATLDALGVLCFVGASEHSDIESALLTLWEVASNVGAQKLGGVSPSAVVQAAALQSWSLVYTTTTLPDEVVEQRLPVLKRLLNSGELKLKTAAGEAIALLHELGLSQQEKDGEEEPPADDEGDSSDEVAFRPLGESHDGVVAAMRALSVTRPNRQSRKDRTAQRSSFRELLGTIEGGECPETRVRLKHGDTMVVDTWVQTLQLNSLRRVLGGGFQRHLQENPLLHEIFEFRPRGLPVERLQGFEKRLYRSPNSAVSKARAMHRQHRRAVARQGNMGHFAVNGGDAD